MKITIKACIGLLFIVTNAGYVWADDAVQVAVEKNEHRLEGDSARDIYRHPREMLEFFGITADQAVVEVNPGGMWMSRILGPLLKEEGHYIGLEHNPEIYNGHAAYSARLRAYPAKLDGMRDMFGDRASAGFIPADMDHKDALAVEVNSVDTVLVVRAMHNWVRRSFFDKAMDQSWRMLKPGGIFAVVQHRAKEEEFGDHHKTVRRGRWKQSEMIRAVESYGFKLVAASEMNANSKDSANYARGVWTLPPGLAMGDENVESYLAVGESDRMTLKFVKIAR